MKTKVSFIFYSSQEGWIGGRNYFISMFNAIDKFALKHLDIVIFLGKNANLNDIKIPENFKIVQSSIFDRKSIRWYFDKFFKKIFGNALLTNQILKKHQIDVVSHVDPVGLKGVKKIAWIPDFQHVHLPHFFDRNELIYRDQEFKSFIQNSDRVIVSSMSAKSDINRFDPHCSNKVRVLRFAAITPNFVDQGHLESIKAKYNICKQFFYVPNQFWMHKNHDCLIEAVHILKDRYPEILLVCSGAMNDYRSADHVKNLIQKIEKHQLTNNIYLLGLIPYQDIASLMLQSIAVINPSLFEGWSTTVEETKALGLPIIVSDIPVHREQCDDHLHKLFFDPNSSIALAECMASSIDQSDRASKVDIEHALADHTQRVMRFSDNFVQLISELK